ncbi:MAG: hypothetical protein ABI430_04860 [Candidatus Taylorbacteria bacterium]
MKRLIKNRQGGFLQIIVIVIIVIIILTYFGNDIKNFLESGPIKEVFMKIFAVFKDVFVYLWQRLVVDILWNMILQPILNVAR